MAARARGLKRIVVGVYGSKPGRAALEWAIKLAKTTGAQVVAVYAIDLPVALPEPYSIPVIFDDTWRAKIEADFTNKWCRPLKASGLKYRTVMKDGRPASVIADVAEGAQADLVVVGRRGRGTVAELLLGSVSHELSLHSRRPVLLVPHRA